MTMTMMTMNTFSGQNRKFQSVIFSKVFGIFRFCKRVRVPDDVFCPLKKIGMLKSVWKGSKCDWQNRPFAVFEVPRYIVQRWRGRLRLGRRPLPRSHDCHKKPQPTQYPESTCGNLLGSPKGNLEGYIRGPHQTNHYLRIAHLVTPNLQKQHILTSDNTK